MQKGLRSKAATTTTLSTWLSGHSQRPPGRPCSGNSSQTGRVYAYGRNRVGPLTIAGTHLPAALVEHPPNSSRPLCPQIWSTHIIPPSHAAGLAGGTTSSQTAMIICDSNGWQRYLRSVPGIVYRRKMAAISALLGVSLPHEARSNARLGWGGEWRPLCGVADVRQREENKQGTRAKTRSMSVSSDLRVTTGDQQLLNLMHAQQCASM
jgi:hypothetical protein